MDRSSAERWVTISAFIVIAVYGYRRITEPAEAGGLKNIAGQGSPVPLGQFVTAWGFCFFVVAILAEASPGFGGPFAILIATADVLNNMQGLLQAVAKQAPQVTGGSTAAAATTSLSVGTQPITSPSRQPSSTQLTTSPPAWANLTGG